MSNLFKFGNFKLHSGSNSGWKIDCDALTAGDWMTLAAMASLKIPPFRRVIGIPNGGLAFARALEKYVNPLASTVLICDDVLTTGGSFEQTARESLLTSMDKKGIVVFNRSGRIHSWVESLFILEDKSQIQNIGPTPRILNNSFRDVEIIPLAEQPHD